MIANHLKASYQRIEVVDTLSQFARLRQYLARRIIDDDDDDLTVLASSCRRRCSIAYAADRPTRAPTSASRTERRYDLRRTFVKLTHKGSAPIDQIRLSP